MSLWSDRLEKKNSPRTKLVNKDHYEHMKARLSLIKNPTVESAIYVMRYQGNEDYVDEFPEMLDSGRQPNLPSKDEENKDIDLSHEVAHICAQLGHTPFQENMQLAFEMGMNAGAKLRYASFDEIDAFHNRYEDNKQKYREITVPEFQKKPAPDISARNEAMYFAAGMYLRIKLDSYTAAKMHAPIYSYKEREAFCNAFANHDDDPPLQLHSGLDWKILSKAPYPLILISNEEWRAIKAVALGMREPKDTDYEKRLTPIKEALVHAHLFFDRPHFIEELKKKQAKGDQGMTP